MNKTENTPFIPVLTVMVDYGGAPFLWLAANPDESGVGTLVCDATHCNEALPISEALWRDFAAWAQPFTQTRFYAEDFDGRHWDWLAFHARGIELARQLKNAVGDAYRVVYTKPKEDPNRCLDERQEICADGTLLTSPPQREREQFCTRIISGGENGAERAALDFALHYQYLHGGWTLLERVSTNGGVPPKYQLTPLEDGSELACISHNIAASDGTLIFNGHAPNARTQAAQNFAVSRGKPCMVVEYSIDKSINILSWILEHRIQTLYITGKHANEARGIYNFTYDILRGLAFAYSHHF